MFTSIDYKLRRFAWWRKFIGAPEPVSPQMAAITRAALELLCDKPTLIAAVQPFPQQTDGTIRIRQPNAYKKVSNG